MAGGQFSPVKGHDEDLSPGAHPSHDSAEYFAALDLGTNNCRLLVAQRVPGSFRVVDSFSRIVRLGEGLSTSGHLSDQAMKRTLQAVHACAEKLSKYKLAKTRFVATQACRIAKNGPSFLREVNKRTGVRFEIIAPEEEARLAVVGCADLFDPAMKGALVVDIGGGSTELSWALNRGQGFRPKLQSWHSAPIGVVTLADLIPEQSDTVAWYEAMRAEAAKHVQAFDHTGEVADHLKAGQAHIVGTSGAVTSLAGVHLKLARYSRRLVDGLWISEADTRAAIRTLSIRDRAGRAAEPCIGTDRADLVLAGAAILEAVLDMWPSDQLRVADRGLREGLILTMMHPSKKRRWRRRGKK